MNESNGRSPYPLLNNERTQKEIMKTLIALIFTAILSLVLGRFLPWWSIAIAAFAISLFIRQSGISAFLAGFLGIFAAWGLYAFWIDRANESILSQRVAGLLPLDGNAILLILVTGIIGGIVGGMAALSANLLVRPIGKGRDYENYYRRKFEIR